MIGGNLMICVLFNVGVAICVGNLQDFRYELDTDFLNKMCQTNTVFEANTDNIIRCLSQCAKDPNCESVIHVKSSSICNGFDLFNPCPTYIAFNGAKFYKMKIQCETNDQVAMVTGTDGIPDDNITATSWYDNDYLPHFARLDGPKAWATPGGADVNQYLQFDFGSMRMVTQIATRGFCCPGEWVQSYMLLRSEDCTTYTATKYHGSQIFPGNWDTTSTLILSLDEPFYARCIRLNPRSWGNWATIQVELYGCPLN